MIIQINVEGLSHEKCQYLARLLRENDIDVAVLLETHVKQSSSSQRYTIHGYYMTDATYHSKYGTATYVREDLNASSVVVDSQQSNSYVTATKVSGITVVNIYKPPEVELPTPALPILPHSTVYTGDFNSHITEWGYRVSDTAGDQLSQLANDNNFHLLYDPKQNGTFHSARWKKYYSQDLCFVTCDDEHQPLPTTGTIEPNFPNSQHRQSIITIGLDIPTISSVPKPRWNFRKANWPEFTKSIAESVNRIPPPSENYQRLCKLIITKAKKYIPRGVRKSYIPFWTNESDALSKKYKESGDPDTGKKLMASLKEGICKRWSDEMAALDFTHSSRRAWSLLRRLGGATHSKRQQPKITANDVAHQLLRNGSVKKDRNQAKHVQKQQREALSDCPETSNLSQAFTTHEIINALKATKAGKAAGPDGIVPDMLKNIGPAAVRWLQAFYDDVMKTANIPKIW